MNEADLILGVPDAPPVPMARLNITYNGQQGELPDLVPFNVTVGPDGKVTLLDKADVLRIATESIRGGFAGITADPNADLKGFEVDPFQARPDMPVNRLSVRPQTPFGQD